MWIDEIEQYNEIIGEFIGRRGKYNSSLFWVNVAGVKWVYSHEMKFHCSMDWIDPVVEKIRSLPFLFTITNDIVIVGHIRDGFERNIPIKDGKKIDAIYQGVVEFIEWYNFKNRK